MITSKSELQDLKRCIVEAELSVDDFKLTEQLDPDGPKEGYFPTGTVTMTYTPTGVARSYDARGGSSWSAKFERDLNLNIFKTR
jgi:hypothetical protein